MRLFSEEFEAVCFLCHGVVLAADFSVVATVDGAEDMCAGDGDLDGLTCVNNQIIMNNN